MSWTTWSLLYMKRQADGGRLLVQTKYYGQGANSTDGSELILKMLLILENGDEPDWVQTIVKVYIPQAHSTWSLKACSY